MIAVALCLVVAISDGDTLKARCGEPGSYQQVTIRLAEIDAPEKGQPYAEKSKESLARRCFQTWATVRPQTLDRYGRTVARVECRGHDVSAEQVERGLAWVHPRYGKDRAIKAYERLAREASIGIWSDPIPIAPWEWRQAATKPGISIRSRRQPRD